jgi:alpha-beta hydrolase superfamily lysophospholipase
MTPTKVTKFPGPGALYALNENGTAPAILLTHGTYSNAETCTPIAQFFAAQNHPVYVIEWRSRGGSPGAFTFHDLADGEIAQAIEHLNQRGPLHLIAHSGGGLALTFAALNETLRPHIASLTLIATQATHLKDAPWRQYQSIRALDWWGRRQGYWSAKHLRMGPCNESATLLHQWLRFNQARRITDRAGQDIFPQLARLNLRTFALAGAADTTIARPDGCFALANAFGHGAQTHLCQASTDGEDFTHARLFKSRAAETYVWPRIRDFITA